MKGFLLKWIFASFVFLIFFEYSYSQCGPATPTFTCDLTGSPSGTWVSPSVIRNDNCCGTTAPNKCVKFIITLDPSAVAINFTIASGAVPPGALFYQINCGPPIAVGSPICLNGPGPHILTFCKPGNNQNTYAITSIQGAASGPDIIINDGCIGDLTVVGLSTPSITWNSIFPGTLGQYNNYLSCAAACNFTTVTAQVGYPPFIDYVVCGTSTAPCATGILCDTVRVTFNPTLFVNIVPQNPTVCFGMPSTSFTAVGSGGTPPYNYLWNTGATTATISGGVGTYTVLMGDATNCPPVSTTVTVTSFSNPITANAGNNIITCGTNPTVTLNGSVTGVTTGQWVGGNGSFVPNNTTLNASYTPTAAEIASGSLTLTLNTTNNGSCPGASDQMTITYTTFTTVLSTSTTPVSCNGGTNGTATVTTSGGFPPYTISWNSIPVQTTTTATNLAAGTYTVTLTDANGCVGTTTATVTEPFPISSNTQQSNVLCNGGGTGSAFVQVFGGVLPYSYAWTPSGATTATASNLSNGTHIVTITDGNVCTHKDTVIISQPLPLTLNITSTNVSCFNGANGTANATVTGGVIPYSYNWSSGSTAQNAANLSAGNYTLTVTDDNGCTINGNVTITQPTQLVASVTPSDVTCFGLNNGSATSLVSGGTPTYSYNWNPGNASTVSSLAPGNHTLAVTDFNGCQVVVPFSISEPPVLQLAIASQSNVSCFGGNDGTASVAATGGTLNYSYSWSPNVGTTATVGSLSAGNYTATVTDANNCSANSIITITEPATALTATTTIVNVTCNGGADGSITAIPSGGTSGYSFFWTFNGSTAATLSGLAAGNYTFIVTDANGCTFTNTVAVTEPLPLSLVPFSNSSTCGLANGSGSVSASGGAGGYTYVWSPNVSSTNTAINILAGSYLVYVTDAVGCMDSVAVNVNDLTGATAIFTNPTNISCYGGNDGAVTTTVTSGNPAFTFLWSPSGSTSQNPTNLVAGINTLEITDGNGCFAYFSITLTQPDSLSLAMITTPVSCFGGNDGTATVFASGGTPVYTYSWTPAAGGGSTGSGFSAGPVSVLVTDTEGCSKTSFITVTEPTPLSVAITGSTNVSCIGGADGTASALASGGTSGYTYLWMPGSIAGATASGLSAGNYTVTATDANGCTSNTNIIITEPATAVSVTFTTTPVSCFGGNNGTATAVPAGGTPGYTYSWTTGSQITQTATTLTAGNHTVVVTDSEGCTVTGIAIVTQPASLTASIVTSSTTCGNANGSASVQVNGGNPNYTYLWTPGNFTTAVINNVASGNYSVTVTDNTGCTANASATILNVPGPTVSIGSFTNVSCFGGNNGSATAAISSGTAPFQILWLPSGGNNLTATGLTAGGYSVTITDANGCQTFASTTITQPTLLNPSILSVTNVSCNGLSDGAITSTTAGGAGGYTFSWSPLGGSSANASNLPAGNYTITVTDQNGCVSTESTSITEPSVLTLSLVSATDPVCFAGNTGEIEVIAGGGTPNYSYTWNTVPVQNSSTATGLTLGSYAATVTDANGCVENITASLGQPIQVFVTASPNDTICGGQSTTISAAASGGSGPYIYIWDQNLGTASSHLVTPPASTTYMVTAFDNFGCMSNTDSLNIQVFYLNGNNVSVIGFTPICPGSTSTVYATVSGNNNGPLTYQWNQGLGTSPGSFQVTPTSPTYYSCTITNACGASITDSVLVDFNPLPTVTIMSDITNGCVPLTINFSDFTNTNTADSIYSWHWDFGNGDTSVIQNPVYTYTQSGTYSVILYVTTYGGCSNNNAGNPYVIDAYPVPVADFSVNQTTINIPGEVLVCTNVSTGATIYSWTFGDGGTSSQTNPIHEYSNLGDMTVTLIASNQYGCADTTSTVITTTSDIVFPNAFTPNTSGSNGGGYNIMDLTNDVFFPYTAGVDNFKLQIFNRWGELIFETDDVRIGWDGYYRGYLCEQGVYVWKAEVLFEDGRKFNKVGDVTLLR